MPDITYNLAPNPVWQFTDFMALFLAGGKMYTYRDLARTTPKPVYKDPAGMTQWPNPLIFSDPDGSQYPIYWASDENYFVEIYDQFGGGPLYTFTQFNAPGFVNPIEVDAPPIKNYVIDGQFRFPVAPAISNIQNGVFFAPKWAFAKGFSVASVDNLTVAAFTPGQTLVPYSPVNYLSITCTSPGTDTSKLFAHFMDDCTMFQGQNITFSFWAQSTFSSTISLQIKQFFGTGGSSAIVTPVPPSFPLTTVWKYYSTTIAVPSISGQTIGPNNDDSFEIFFNLPLSSVYNVQITNVQVQLGQIPTPYDFNGYNLERSKSFGQKLPIPLPGVPSPNMGNYVTLGTETSGGISGEPAFIFTVLPLYTGFVMPAYVNPASPYPGWVIANGTFVQAYINNQEGYKLYQLLQEIAALNSTSVGIGTDGFSPMVSGNNVIVTNEEVGSALDSVDVNTGMTITVTVPGNLSTQQVTEIFCLPAVSLLPGTYFYMYSVTYSYYCYITINGIGEDPKIGGYTAIPIPLTSGMTAAQVAAIISFQLQGTVYAAPDLTGYFVRFGPTNPASVRDPDYTTRNGGNNIGSIQGSALGTHTHTYQMAGGAQGTSTGGTPVFNTNTPTETSAPNGSNPVSTGETRGINVYLLPLMKL